MRRLRHGNGQEISSCLAPGFLSVCSSRQLPPAAEMAELHRATIERHRFAMADGTFLFYISLFRLSPTESIFSSASL
jgi:hypothetical protein